MKRNRVAVTLLVTAIVAAGCGGATKKAVRTTVPPSTTTTVPPTTTTVPPSTTVAPTTTVSPATTAVTIDPALAAKAAAAILKPTDFPYGWTPQPPDPTGGLQIDRLWQNWSHCLNVDAPPPTPVQATSPTFKQGLATSAISTVEYTTPSSAAAIAASLGGPALPGCITGAFNANAALSHPDGAVPSPATALALNAPQVGDKTYAFRVNVTMNLGALQIKLFHDFLVVFKGSTVIRMWFLNPGAAFPTGLEQTLVADVVNRA